MKSVRYGMVLSWLPRCERKLPKSRNGMTILLKGLILTIYTGPPEKYTLFLLGEGEFGVMHKAVWNVTPVAAKKLPKSRSRMAIPIQRSNYRNLFLLLVRILIHLQETLVFTVFITHAP
jgi:hypothetical protein